MMTSVLFLSASLAGVGRHHALAAPPPSSIAFPSDRCVAGLDVRFRLRNRDHRRQVPYPKI